MKSIDFTAKRKSDSLKEDEDPAQSLSAVFALLVML